MKNRLGIGLLLIAMFFVHGCGLIPEKPDGRDAAEVLAKAMQQGELAEVITSPDVDLQAEWDTIMAGMDDITPVVRVGESELSVDRQVTTATLAVEWPFESDRWGYQTTATFRLVEGEWSLQWTPALIHPQLTDDTRLTHQFLSADRANILGRHGEPIMMSREVFEVGIDKQQLGDADPAVSARALANLLKVDPETYVDRVEAAGPLAFVVALVLRGGSPAVLPEGLSDIPGARAIPSHRILAPTRDFAVGIVGSVAPADAKQVEASGGRINQGDWVGVSGLQARYDEQLRGLPGDRVVMVDRETVDDAAQRTFVELFRSEPSPGEALRLTMDPQLQQRAEELLADVEPAASIVVLERETGAILAAANGPGDGANPHATFGRYAPGSTFKPVTALALLRAGSTVSSPVECTTSFTVDGRQFKNYSDFPSGQTGRTTLVGAMASSCNTAFIAEHERITPQDLTDAAASLGLGRDYDAGFPIFYGSVPEPTNVVGKAESLIGQGLVESSPVAMAGVMASIASGKTVVPYLIETHRPEPSGPPLTADEAAALRQMLEAVVGTGTGRSMSGVLQGAKTGTAEYGADSPPKTHAWMVGWDDEVAVAVFVHDGPSGSSTAGPLVKALLN